MIYKQGPTLEFFSEEKIAFLQELPHHPAIATRVVFDCSRDAEGNFDEGEMIGTVAAQFGIVMDGVYSREDINHMYDMLFHKMRDLRREIILPQN